ncbi:response regulator [Pantoea sp. EA-12]|uniref:response regulator n=1 Tax=Pantoea sp. EA-12 TaxID=3043303 RepID=UPI0024B4B3FF|nr:response regulator [Pantoea sp. EA-12]MDI9220860.1 response regulator [Pantoea sp. EA-12]
MKNVLIVDDHPVTRFALKLLLEKQNLVVVAEVNDGLQALVLVKKVRPDLLIIDIDIPSLNGIDVVQRIRNQGSDIAILVLSAKDSEHYIRRCASAGADGFISKRKELAELHDALSAMRRGYGYFPGARARRLMLAEAHSAQDKIATLTAREMDVMRYLAQGMKIVEIAKVMKISDKTISTYKCRMMEKLELKNMIDLYDFTLQHNLD